MPFTRRTLCENMSNNLWLGTVITQINSPRFGGYYNQKALFIFFKCVCYTYHWSKAIKFIRGTLETLNTTSVKGITPNRNNNSHYVKMKKKIQNYLLPFFVANIAMGIYVVCVQFMLHTTYSIVSLSECKKSFLVKLEPIATKNISQMEMKFYIFVWIWYTLHMLYS